MRYDKDTWPLPEAAAKAYDGSPIGQASASHEIAGSIARETSAASSSESAAFPNWSLRSRVISALWPAMAPTRPLPARTHESKSTKEVLTEICIADATPSPVTSSVTTRE